jgi:hypothetical protein
MKTLAEIVGQYRLVIWDGISDIKCGTGIFTASEIKRLWGIGNGVNVFYVTARNGTVAKVYGTDLGSPFDSEDVVECGKLQISDMATQEYRNQPDADATLVCDMQTVEDNLLVVDLRNA